MVSGFLADAANEFNYGPHPAGQTARAPDADNNRGQAQASTKAAAPVKIRQTPSLFILLCHAGDDFREVSLCEADLPPQYWNNPEQQRQYQYSPHGSTLTPVSSTEKVARKSTTKPARRPSA
jgi:hypothetical protein